MIYSCQPVNRSEHLHDYDKDYQPTAPPHVCKPNNTPKSSMLI